MRAREDRIGIRGLRAFRAALGVAASSRRWTEAVANCSLYATMRKWTQSSSRFGSTSRPTAAIRFANDSKICVIVKPVPVSRCVSTVFAWAISAIANQSGAGFLSCASPTAPGYRVYYGRRDNTVVILLFGGEKKRQSADIERAVAYWTDYLARTQ